jgi:hypothetical protein
MLTLLGLFFGSGGLSIPGVLIAIFSSESELCHKKNSNIAVIAKNAIITQVKIDLRLDFIIY